jgi:putative SOS response-associated peptidase YedK
LVRHQRHTGISYRSVEGAKSAGCFRIPWPIVRGLRRTHEITLEGCVVHATFDDVAIACEDPEPKRVTKDAERELTMMRWGMPPPPKFGGPPVTNIRNTSSPHWRGWLKPENRCLVPANSFSEYAPEANPVSKKKDVVWFALNEERPLFAFAGIWTEFRGDRGTKSKPIPGPHLVYGFITTEPNGVVAPMPSSQFISRIRWLGGRYS